MPNFVFHSFRQHTRGVKSVNLKVLIAEDERLAREELIYLLSKEPGITLLPSATNGREMLELIDRHEPEAVFLDIQMPELNGIEAARQLKSRTNRPCIVFTTAHEGYAVEAFRLNAVDYLLKPYDHQRLKETLNRIRKNTGEYKVLHNANKPQNPPAVTGSGIKEASANSKINKLLIDDGNKLAVIDPETIIYAVKAEKTTQIHTSTNQCYYSKMTLQELQEKLAAFPFFRSHRSYLVNLNHILEIEPWFNGAYNLILKDAAKTRVPVSRFSAKELLKLLKGE